MNKMALVVIAFLPLVFALSPFANRMRSGRLKTTFRTRSDVRVISENARRHLQPIPGNRWHQSRVTFICSGSAVWEVQFNVRTEQALYSFSIHRDDLKDILRQPTWGIGRVKTLYHENVKPPRNAKTPTVSFTVQDYSGDVITFLVKKSSLEAAVHNWDTHLPHYADKMEEELAQSIETFRL